uniref:RICTOR_N domain-containing protein n=1 Tax=Macrostomum lignano TaxID=282301 RepID=A0A1I8FJE2_9PLAT
MKPFTTYDKTVPKEIRDRLLSLFCSFVCGSQNNALYLITPATLEALWKIADQSQWFVIALTCILEILGGLPKYQNPSDSMDQIFRILSSITYSEGAIAVSDCLTAAGDNSLPMSALLDRLFDWALGEPFDSNRIHRIRDGHVIGILVDLACRRWRQPDCSGLADAWPGCWLGRGTTCSLANKPATSSLSELPASSDRQVPIASFSRRTAAEAAAAELAQFPRMSLRQPGLRWAAVVSCPGQLLCCEAFAEPLSPARSRSCTGAGQSTPLGLGSIAAVLTADTSTVVPLVNQTRRYLRSRFHLRPRRDVRAPPPSSLAFGFGRCVAAAAAVLLPLTHRASRIVGCQPSRVISADRQVSAQRSRMLRSDAPRPERLAATARLTSACRCAGTVHSWEVHRAFDCWPMLERAAPDGDSCRSPACRASVVLDARLQRTPDADRPELPVLAAGSTGRFPGSHADYCWRFCAGISLQALRSQPFLWCRRWPQGASHLIDAFFLRELEMLLRVASDDEVLRDKSVNTCLRTSG